MHCRQLVLLGVLLLFQLRPIQPSGLNRFNFSDAFYQDPSGLFNPAAVWNPAVGWVAVFRWDRCFYQRCGIHHTGTAPLLSVCGKDARAPDLQAASDNYSVWSFEPKALNKLKRANEASTATSADLRLFNFGGEVLAGHWMKFGWAAKEAPAQHKCWSDGWGDPHSCEYTAISRLNFQKRQLELLYQFRVPIIGTTYRSEKNWAFLERGDRLSILYSMLPCTAIFTYDPASTKGAVFEKGLCYADPDQTIASATGLQLSSARLSGNPVPWTHHAANSSGADMHAPGSLDFYMQASEPTRELLGMVHARQGRHDYAHWALRLDADSLAITHISTRPVLQSKSYSDLGGYFAGVLIVGSFHEIWTPDGQQVLRLLIGEGDQYSAWEDVPLADIDWTTMPHPFEAQSEDEVLAFDWKNRQ
ncbi:hypothetical protein WJX73_003016 [Symbiochloris irregularis]|uniref:Uncharacterized protein n=1 Tax=Symbiochloris irregularis TaxID=706552 RepID=A0AAW1PZR2_9CHLO